MSAVNREERTIWIADAHRGDGKHFGVRADEILTAFLELESAIHRRSFCIDRQPKFSADSTSLNGSKSRGGHSR